MHVLRQFFLEMGVLDANTTTANQRVIVLEVLALALISAKIT
jgi:hypothetical protein